VLVVMAMTRLVVMGAARRAAAAAAATAATAAAGRSRPHPQHQWRRIGRHAIVSVPNFGHWRLRAQILFLGRMPVTKSLPDTWYDTQNIHLCTIRDFVDLCDAAGARMERAVALNTSGYPVQLNAPWWFWNLFGAQAVFLLTRR
jgi:methionine biosynthesis protein MetW